MRKREPSAKIYYAFEKDSRFKDLPRQSKDLDGIFEVRAGKFRRYYGRSKVAAVLDVPTNARNARDVVYTGVGWLQSRRLLKRLQPDVVFIKGSSVGVPIGKACKSLGIPYFTHDSDSVASLTNRLLAKDAVVHAVGLPLGFYSRGDQTLHYTGIPLRDAYRTVDRALQDTYRQTLAVPTDALVLTVTGGSLGAAGLNDVFGAVAPRLLEAFPELYILHQTGRAGSPYVELPEALRPRVREVTYTDDLAAFTGAANLVVARAGATTIAELAVQGKACVFIPGAQLTGGQQVQNGKFLAEHKAAVVVPETEAADTDRFFETLSELLYSKAKRTALAAGLSALAKADAAAELTDIIVSVATNKHV